MAKSRAVPSLIPFSQLPKAVYVHVDMEGVPHDANLSKALADEMGPGRETVSETEVHKYILDQEVFKRVQAVEGLLQAAAEACSDVNPDLSKNIYAKLADLQILGKAPTQKKLPR